MRDEAKEDREGERREQRVGKAMHPDRRSVVYASAPCLMLSRQS
jgi:hypothetical protein